MSPESAFAQKLGIAPNGNTQTTVSTAGAVTNVTTNTIRGVNAYNSFSTFNVNQGNTVNLFLPNGVDNLLNLVNSQSSTIDGILNAIKNGTIGGNLFFANPFGFIVGKTGIVNAGSFLAVTPTTDFMNQFFTAPGVPSPSATASLLNGTVPITPDGLISVQGKINAAQSIGLQAGTVTNSGSIASGAVFSGTKPDFSDVVNVAGLQSGAAISAQNGDIEIKAVGDFENSGTISTNGANNLNAGNIDIHAGNNINLDPGSLISASGQGQNSNGGSITILADKNSVLSGNAVVAAAGGDVSGNGGSVDFSAKGTATLNGGVLKAGAVHGTAGTVTIDPTDLNITQNDTPNDGSNLSFSGDTITVLPGIVVSSRQIGSGTDFLNSPSTGNSGSITFTANSNSETPTITVGDGAQILAHATNGFTPGAITLTASQTSNAAQATAAANINIGNGLIQGGDININATAQATADSSVHAAVTNQNFVDSKLNLVNGLVAENTSSATSGINIGDSNSGTAQINASGALTINSTATASTTSKLASVVGLAYGESDSTATATIGRTAALNAGGALTVNANSNNTLNVKETISLNSTDVAAFAYGNGSSNSSTQVDGSVTGGSVQIGATNTNNFSTVASATDYGTQATSAAGAGIALGFYQSNANTTLTGSATSTGGDVQIASASTNTDNTTRSSSSLPSQGIKAKIAQVQNWTQTLDGSSGLLNKIASGQSRFGSAPAVASQANSTQLGLSAAVSIAKSGNSATTTVSGNVTSQGKVNVGSQATDDPQISAAGSVGGENADLGGAVAVSDFHNTANTYVNGNAAMTGARAVSITAEADIVNPASQPVDQVASGFTGIDSTSDLTNDTDLKRLVSSITTALAGAADPGVFTTSYVNTGMSTAGDSSGGFGIGGAVNLLGLTNQSVANVTGSAHVTANTGDLSVNATSKAALINVAGMGLGAGQIASFNPGVQAGTSIGGSYNGVNLSNTSTAYIGDGTIATATQGNVNVNAATNTFAIDLAQAGDKATKFGITGTFDDGSLIDNAEAYIQSNANVNASQAVNVTATNALTAIAVGGALGFGGSGQVGVAVNWNQIDNTTLAYIGDPSNPLTSASGRVTGSGVNLTANSNEGVYGITFAATKSGSSGQGADGESSSPPDDAKTAPSAPTSGGGEVKGESGDNGAGGGQYGFGISGEIAFNQVANGSGPGVTTQAFINNGANVTGTNGNVSLTATDTSFAVAGGLAGTVGQTNALAGAYSQNTFDKQVQAFTGNTTITGDGLNIQANSNGSLFDVTAGGAVNTVSGTALAGSVNNNSITNTVSASLGNGTNASNIGSNGITINASEGSNADQVLSVAGGFGVSVGEVGVGAAVDVGNYTNNVSSSIGGTNVGTTGNVAVTSSTNVNYLPIAASLAFGSDFGVSGSAAVEQITDTTTSTASGTVAASGNLVIGSNDSSSALIIGGGVGLSGDIGVGLTAVIPQFSRTTESLIGNGANISAQGNGSAISYDGQSVTGTLLDAKTSGNLQDYSVAGGASGSASIAGAVILNPFYASNPNSLKDDTEANIGSNAVVNSSNNGAAGQSVTLLASDNSGIQDAAGMLAIGGDLGVGVGFDLVTPSWTVNTSIGSGANVNAKDNVLAASNLQNFINSYAVSGSGSGEAAFAAAVSSINETSNTIANVGGTVAAGGNVDVSAIRNTSKLNSLDGNAAVALNIGAGFGISSSVINTNDTVDASLGGAANVTALGNGGALNVPNGQLDASGNPVTGSFQGLSVTAMSYGSVNPIAAGGAGSGGISADGSAPVTNLTETTKAHIDSGATVNTNNSGANFNESVQTLATDETNLNSIAGTLGAGLGSLAAALDFDTVSRTVTANISGANVNAANNLTIGALTEGSLQSTAASGSVGGFSGAGAASTINETTNTNAYIDGGSNVSANNNVAVAANRNTRLTIHDGGAAFGALDGLAASVADVNQSNTVQSYVGTNTSVTALGQGAGVSAPVDSSGNPATGTVSGLSVTAQGNETLQIIAAGGAVGSGVGLSGSTLTNSLTENTSAKIDGGTSINTNNAGAGSGQGVNLLASDTTNLTAGAGALGGADNGVGIGVGLDAENIHKTTTAGIDSGANLKARGAVNVDALSKETINSYTAAVGIGVGGGAGTSADYQTHPISPTTNAYVSAATVNAGSLGLNANENLTLTADTGEVSAGGVALGAATALVTANANTSASISGGSVTLNPNGALSVISGYSGTLNGTALSGGGGFVAANASYAQLADNSSNSASLNGTVPQAGAINVDANTTRSVSTTGGALNVSGLGAGAVIMSSSTSGSTTASVNGSIGQTTGEDVQALGISAVDNSSNSASSSAISAGIGAGQYNRATATRTGTVQASIGDSSAIQVAGNLTLSASAADPTSNANTSGLNIGGVGVGESQATATDSPTVRAVVGQNATLGAGQNSSINAAYNYNYNSDSPLTGNTVAATSSSSVGSLVGSSGATSSASSTPTVQASFGNGSTIGAGGNLTVQSLSGNTISSDANGNLFGVATSAGNTTSTSTISNNNAVATGSSVTLAAGNNLTLSSQSTNNISNASAEGTQGGVVSTSNNTTRATASLTDTTNTTVGTSNQVNGGTSGTALIQALANNQANSNSTDLAANAFGGTNTATANTNVTTNNTTEVSGSSNVQAGTVSLDAEVTNEHYTATAVSKTFTVHSDATANSNVEVTSNVNANVDNGANLTGGNAITIKADQENLLGNSSATAKVVGASGSPTANSDNNVNDNSNVNIAPLATLTTNNLSVEAIAPYDKGASYEQTASAAGDTTVTWVTETVEETVDEVFGWIPYVKEVTKWVTRTVEDLLHSDPTANQTGSFNPSNTITMSGTIVQPGGINPVLVANTVGGNVVFTRDVNVNAAVSGNTITVNDLVNQIEPSIAFNAPNGTVQGNFTVQRNTTWTGVSITNNTSDNLVINNINPLTSASAANPDVNVSAANNTSSFTLVDTNTGTTGIVVQNNSGSNVTLAGVINDPGGSITVNNTGGNIFATGSELLKDANTTLDATAGSVGSSGNYMNVQMTAETSGGNSAPANLSVTAGQNVFLNAQLVQDVVNTAPASIAGPANITSIAAGGAVNLNLLQPQSIVYGVSSDNPPVLTVTPVNANGTYNINNVNGGNNVNINQAAGPMNIGTVTSTNGNVNLTAQAGDVDLGTVNSTNGTTHISASGSIIDTNHTSASDINAVNVNLTAANGSIGTSADLLNIDSSYSGAAGQVTASANLGVYLNQVAGNLNLGMVTSTTSDAVLTSAGSIMDTNSAAGSAINANNVTLTATNGSIGGGAGAGNTLDIDATGQLTATANQNANITQTTGPMQVNTVTATNGNVNLAASSGDVDLGTVNSGRNTTVVASGSISDNNGTTASSINAVNVSLTATNGSIGGGNSAGNTLDINASGQLTAQANQDVHINQTTGAMNVNTVGSTTGNVTLTAPAGDVTVGTVNSGRDTTIVASGSISDNNSTRASSINAVNVNLTATNGSIGGGTGAGNTLDINASGQLTATANQNANITQTTGPMNVNTVNATNGNVNLVATNGDVDLGTVNSGNNTTITASGSISDNNSTAASSINAVNVSLTATNGSIGGGTGAGNTLDIDATGQLTTAANQNVNITQTAGPMKVNTVSATNGSVNLTTISGDVDLGTVTARNGNITVGSYGSILNTSGGNSSSVNLTGKNITLTATHGSIGNSSSPLFVNNENPTTLTNGVPSGSNLLNTTASVDTYITEASGNLLSNSISSATGNIGLVVSNGNGNLNQIVGNQAVSLLVNGSLLNIGTIIGSTGTSAKAPSPNTVSLIVSNSGGALTVNQMSVFQSVFTRADNTNLNQVIVTNLANPQLDTDRQAQSLHFNDAGYSGGIANTINVNIVPCSRCYTSPAVIFDNYLTQNGNVFASMDWLEFINTELTGSGQFQNAWENFIITGKRNGNRIGPWYFFLIGDKFARNADPFDTVSPARFLQLPNHYVWVQDPTVVFPYLLNLYGFSTSTTSSTNF